jgi:CHAT domain-containing protein
VAHFACHAYAAISDPLSSRVELGPGQESWLTLSDLLRTGLPGARLAVLSACQTGVPGSGEPDQYVSLAAGFIQSGAAGVIATMCPVSDLTASRLMERFYELWARWPDDPAMALCTAQREMSTRGATASVGDWVPFYYLGALPARHLAGLAGRKRSGSDRGLSPEAAEPV